MGNLIPSTGSSLNILSLRLSSAETLPLLSPCEVQVLGSVHMFFPQQIHYFISFLPFSYHGTLNGNKMDQTSTTNPFHNV